ncbi:MAG TPA: hypothetical protein VMM92_05840 [Thermoanaerobaculia bacterium]|nr:hypothetical protein [Thermoanaerobaculia bacterium]
MVYRYPHAAPQSQLPEERRGRMIGYFCHTCGSIYPEHRARHSGKPLYGRDHVASPCSHEGEAFDPADPADRWWEPAVEVLPEAARAKDDLVANSPAKGTEPEATGAGKAAKA